MDYDDKCITSSDRVEDDVMSSHGNLPLDLWYKLGPAKSVYELLTCTLCVELLDKEMRQCCSGHLFCGDCIKKLSRCPNCKNGPVDIRCVVMEQLLGLLVLPCTYSSVGCPEILPYFTMCEHVKECGFGPYNCPYSCCFIGDIPDLVTHLTDKHNVDMYESCIFNHRYGKPNFSEFSWTPTVYQCFGQYFYLHFEAFELGTTPVYIAYLRFMGAETDARNFRYILEVGENSTKLRWEGKPRSIRDSQKGDIHYGLRLMQDTALSLSSGDQKELNLRVVGKILKERPNYEGGACIHICS